jgi:hypothetical protein
LTASTYNHCTVTKLIYNWPRFWVPLGKSVPFDGHGFLVDPEDEHARYYYVDYLAQLLSQLIELPVAILLGELGIGKSTALKEEFHRLQAEGQACLYSELNQYHSDSRLICDIFDSAELHLWRTGHHHLTLLLDSLDECSLTIPSVARILAIQFKGLPTNRLSLRLTCRTADWPEHFTNELREIWPCPKDGVDSLGVFELAPLREKDILRAATDCDLDSEAFSKEIQIKEIQPLAGHPNTLNMLLSLFVRPDGLPKQRAELYRLGCLTLAADSSTSRKESHHVGKLNERQRMIVAGRIAAQLIFGHRSTIWRGKDWEAETADLIEKDIVGQIEHADGHDFPIDSLALREAIECALFSGRGERRIGFAHQSYVEFLAAWYLHSCGLDAQRALPLLLHPDDKRVPPQHAETAIWLAALDGDVFAALVETEPLLLLRTDLSDTTDEQKALLTETVLKALASKTEVNRYWGLHNHYRKLAHPALADQLRHFIVNQDAYYDARIAAMGIAAACRVCELAEELITIALNTIERHKLRSYAAFAACDLANDSQLIRLRPIALEEAGDDPEDELKSVVIHALWPAHISVEEVFKLLEQLQNVRCLGNFRYAPKEFVEQFSADDLILALHWVAYMSKDTDAIESGLLKDAIMIKAWSKLDNPHVLRAFAETVWTCIERYESLFNRRGERKTNWLEQDIEKRRISIIALLEAFPKADCEFDLASWTLVDNQIIQSMDADWLLERYWINTLPSLSIKLAKCINYFVRWDSDSAWLDAVVAAACNDALHPESPLADVVALWMEPILLDSEAAWALKEQHVRQQERKLNKPPLLDPPPTVRVAEALQEFKDGKKDSWWRLWRELSLPDEAVSYPWSTDNVTKLPGWQRAEPAERSGILRCADAWLIDERLTQADIFLPNNSFTYLHTATYLALQLMFEEQPQSLVIMPPETWSHLAEALIAYPSDGDLEQRKGLIELAYEKAPETVLKTFQRIIERDIASPLLSYRVRELAIIWDARVAALLHEFLTKSGLASEYAATLLDVLLEHSDETAYEFARAMVKAADNQQFALVAATALLAHQARKSWQLIWEVMCSNVSFGEALMLNLPNYSYKRDSNILASLSEPEIAELYFWLEEHFPSVNDDDNSVTTRYNVQNIRDNCPSYLSGLGTHAAIGALHSICERFPDEDWLKHRMNQAKQVLRKTTLKALSPSELIAYTHRRNARLARSSSELMEAVLVSLQRLQEKLCGQTPLVPFLWDLSDNGKSGRPKSEDRLTDFLKHHLEGDLPNFVIDREVQIRNLKEHGIGERTDLKIETKDQDGRSIAVIIESKGCWNKELMTAMQSQLHGRYLKLAGDACGIYLVGWFVCERWVSQSDCAFKGTKGELQAELTNQAKSLSGAEGGMSTFVLDASY